MYGVLGQGRKYFPRPCFGSFSSSHAFLPSLPFFLPLTTTISCVSISTLHRQKGKAQQSNSADSSKSPGSGLESTQQRSGASYSCAESNRVRAFLPPPADERTLPLRISLHLFWGITFALLSRTSVTYSTEPRPASQTSFFA